MNVVMCWISLVRETLETTLASGRDMQSETRNTNDISISHQLQTAGLLQKCAFAGKEKKPLKMAMTMCTRPTSSLSFNSLMPDIHPVFHLNTQIDTH